MVAEIPRFQREARALIDDVSADGVSLGDWLHERRYSRAFVDRLIVPQASAVWSADPREMWRFPARFLARFFHNHGMLGLRDRPHGAPSQGARRSTSMRSCARGAHRIRVAHAGHGDPAATTTTSPCGPRGGDPERFDEVVLAAHSDQALRMLADANGASASSSVRSPTSATKPSCTPTASCSRGAAGPGRAGTTICSTTRRPARP